ncbi:MFS transporter [Allokutzneria albata]|uniref:Predicted arabinose efflux permease, MFS family n=1 Tax=Allokutzneria albata TaxID=211114 RepID=A0A1G9SE87_ALLAB|nr:MFS transporter [Allokutzneria albata]SDM33115.1 Predicted arabinose efflux permease, MFS family [Allokutzneria albata]
MLPLRSLLPLSIVVLLGCLTEVLPAGLLLGMSADFDVSPATAGHLVTGYAITTALTAIPLTALISRLPRKAVLLALVLGFAVTNFVIAVSPWYSVVLVARIASGAITGVMWSLVAVYAMRIAPPALSGRALAVVMAGTPLGFAVGVPAGTALGDLVGWRWSFALMGAVAVPLFAWVAAVVPPVAPEPAARRLGVRAALTVPRMGAVLAMVLGFSLAHNTVYTYLGPVLAGFGRQSLLSTALLVFGGAAVAGILVVGGALDRFPRGVPALCAVTAAVAVALVQVSDGEPSRLLPAMALWGLAFGGAPTAFQAVTAMIAGRTADAAQSLTIASWNGAVAGGAALGGLVLDTVPGALVWTSAALMALPLLSAVRLGVGRERLLSAPHPDPVGSPSSGDVPQGDPTHPR